jgi:hypothetical protein
MKSKKKMSKKKRVTLLILLSILSILFIKIGLDQFYYYFVNGKDPIKTVEQSLKVRLPDSTEIVNYRYNKKEGCYDLQVRIDEKDTKVVEKDFVSFFGDKRTLKQIQWPVPNFKNTTDWWNLDYSTVEYAFYYISGGYYPRGSFSIARYFLVPTPNWVFICKEVDGHRDIYISSRLDTVKK